MANKYWAAGVSGNWNSAASWSDFAIGTPAGAVVPGAGDAAIFNAASGTVTATLDISPDIQTLTCTGFTGTLAFGTNTISLNSTGTIFTGATTMAVTGTPQIIATNATATARTITPAAVTEANSISFRVTAGTGTLGLTAGSYRNLDFTDGTNPTGYGGALTGSTSITIYGDLKASTNMTVGAGSGVFTFAATSGTKTINTANVTFDKPFTFNGVGGTWQLQDALTSGATRACTLTNGTLDLNDYTATFGSVSSSNSNARTFAFGSTGKIVLTGTAATLFTTSTATNLTVTGTNPLIQLTTAATTGTRGITMGAAGEANAISVDVTSGSDTIGFGTTSGSYKNVNFTGFTGTYNASNSILVFGNWNFGGVTLLAGTSTVNFSATSGTKTITSNGVSFPAAVTFNGVGGTWQLQDALTSGATRTTTLTNGTLDLNNYTLTTGIFSSSNANARTLDFGDTNFGRIIVTGSGTTVCNTSTATGLTVTGTGNKLIILDYAGGVGTRTVTGASVATAIEGTNLLDYFVASGSDTITFTSTSAYGTIDFDFFGPFAGTFTNNAIFIYGNLVLSSVMAVTAGTNAWTFAATTVQTITTAGLTFDFPVTFDGIGGTFVLVGNLTLGSTKTLTFANGTIFPDQNNNSTITAGSFVTTGTNQKLIANIVYPTYTSALSVASGTVSVSYLNIEGINAIGGAVFQAFLSNFNNDLGNNTGWDFGVTPAISNEITMRLRSFTQPRRF